MENKLDQFKYIDKFLYDSLSKEELRELVYRMLKDESLFRSLRLYSSMNGAFV